ILLIALDELASTVVAMMVLFAIVNVTIFLVFGGLASRTHVSNDHGELLTSTGWVCARGSTVPQISVGEHYMDITTRMGGGTSDYMPIADGSGDRRYHGRASRQRKGGQVCRVQRTGRARDPQ